MKHFNHLLIALLLCFSSCRYRDHVVQISSAAPKIKITQHYDKKLDVRVVDNRENKDFIGFRTPAAIWKFKDEYKNPDYFLGQRSGYHYKIANLTNDQDVSNIVQTKLSAALIQKGSKLEKFSSNQVKVEILELSLIPTMYRNAVHSKFKVTASVKLKSLEKVYDQQMVNYRPMLRVLLMGPFDFGSSGGYYDDIIEECLDKNIEQVINDGQIWDFLK